MIDYDDPQLIYREQTVSAQSQLIVQSLLPVAAFHSTADWNSKMQQPIKGCE